VKLDTLAYPFGAKPTEENEKYVLNGTYEGYTYSYKIGFREGPSKPRFYPVIHSEFEPLNAPRLRGNEGEIGDMWSYFKTYEENPNLRFISDGNKDVITIKAEDKDKVNNEKINGKQVFTY